MNAGADRDDRKLPLGQLATSELLKGFPVVIDWPVQWGDQDALGHVNNTVYFRWCESARVAYLQRLGLAAWLNPTVLGPILAQIECNYKRQLHFPDSVLIGTRITRLGKTSLSMEHAIVSNAQNAIVAESSSVIVVFNYQTQRPALIPNEVRTAIEGLEGRMLADN
ncbi:Long-chain acyl-CoA thioesterase FadM [Anatilimnocola aggregata]|uniref:Long-chain acyl-CoA thioesterase FadM n=1 Tax=Anatilimnocola aggregata TaxID=2528021 RepID=A0A517YAJ7_9BACT|nr:thioesterase family protein [Anatilimnocola aggregata]QDU27259.1 Long-chain acyl-CoA thioesterase FadM [Anatilimnocola aggregata]